MQKYIIKNCPAFSLEPTKTGNICKKWCKSKPCQHYTHCLLKQIVDKCKSRAENSFDNSYLFAEDLLELLEIEEVNE